MENDSSKTSGELERDEHGRLLPGQESLNPNGRPKGKTMKEYAREWLLSKSDTEKRDFLNSLDPSVVWRMAEGNPHETKDVTSGGKPIPILGNVHINHSDKEDSESKETH